MRRTRTLALLVVGLLLLPGLAAAHGCLTGGVGGCARPQPVSHDCCPPPAASLLASCCAAGSPTTPSPVPTAERLVPPAVAAPVVAAIAPTLPALLAAPLPLPLPAHQLAASHSVLRR